MKLLCTALLALSSFFPAPCATQIDASQVKCPGSALAVVLSQPVNGKMQTTCIAMDPAGFKLNTSVNPPVLQLVLPAQAPPPAVPTFVYAEVPAGTIDADNQTFTLVNSPNPPVSLELTVNGLVYQQGMAADYVLTGNTIVFAVPPQPGDVLLADYTH